MGRRFVRLVLSGILIVVGVRACQDWQEKQAAKAARGGPQYPPSVAEPGDSAAGRSSTAEAGRTQRMEAQSQAIQQQYDTMRTTPMTEAERQRAAQDILDQQRRLANDGQSPPPQ